MTAKKRNTGDFNYRESLKPPRKGLISKIKWVDLYLNRPLAAVIVRLVYFTPITPNGLSCVTFSLGILAAFFFSLGDYLYFILGGVFAQLSSIVDGADGMLARSRHMCSEYGAHLDLFFDRIVDFSIFVGIAVGAGAYFKSANLLFLGVLGAGLNLLQTSLFYLTKSYLQTKEKGETGELRAVLYLLLLICAAANRLDIFIYLVLAESLIGSLMRFLYFIYLGRKKGT